MKKFHYTQAGTFNVSDIPCVVHRVILGGITDATITLKDGADVFSNITQASAISPRSIEFGCRCDTNLSITLSAATSVTVVISSPKYIS